MARKPAKPFFVLNLRIDTDTERARRRLQRRLGLSAVGVVMKAIHELDRQEGDRAEVAE